MFRQYPFQPSSELCGGYQKCITLLRVGQIRRYWSRVKNNKSVHDFINGLKEKDQIIDAMGVFQNVFKSCKPDGNWLEWRNRQNKFPSGLEMTWEKWLNKKRTEFPNKITDPEVEKKRKEEETLRRCNKWVRVYFGFVMTLPTKIIYNIFNKIQTTKDDQYVKIIVAFRMYTAYFEYLNIKTVKEANEYCVKKNFEYIFFKLFSES